MDYNVMPVEKIVGIVHLKISVHNAFKAINLLITYVLKISKTVRNITLMELVWSVTWDLNLGNKISV